MFGTALYLLATLGGTVTAQSNPIRAGTYDLEVTYGGGVLDGTLELGFAGDSITVKLHVGEHSPVIHSVKRSGSRLTLTGAAGFPLVYELQFNGDSVSGVLSFNGEDGTVTGKRRTPKRP